MDELATLTDTVRSAVLRAAEDFGFRVLNVEGYRAFDFVVFGREDLWTYNASADLADTQGAGHLLAVVGKATEHYPANATQLQQAGASCMEKKTSDGGKLTVSSWQSSDGDDQIIVNRVILILASGAFIDVKCSNQDSQSSGQSRPEPPFDLDTIRKIVEND